jgi:hypothetical protein
MVWPIIRGESYVGETGKSIKAVELAVSQEGCCRNIPIALIDRVVSAIACFRQLPRFHLPRDAKEKAAL